MAYHDELADLKSYFDGRLKDDAIDLKCLVCVFVFLFQPENTCCTQISQTTQSKEVQGASRSRVQD